jgi:hypothetical protein
VLLKTPNPDRSKGQCFYSCRGFPYREIGTCDVAIHSPTNLRTPNSDGTCAISSPRHLLSPPLIGNRGIAISPVTIPLHNKTPNVESRLLRICATCPYSDRRLRLIGKSLIAISTHMKLLPLGTPICRIPMAFSPSFLRLRTKSLAASPRSDGQRDFAILSLRTLAVDSPP